MQINNRGERSGRRGNHGLTVLELLIVVAAVAIVVSFAVPGSNMLLDKYRMKHAYSSIVSGLELARSEASARNSTVVLCPSSNGHTCRKDANWNYGWLVFSDGNGNGTVQDIELIRSFEAPSQEITILAIGAVENRAAFTTMGLSPYQKAHSGRFHICLKESDAPASAVEIDADGWVTRVPNNELSCSNV
jgi:type IV fimbrial biogenesis protein FimT